MLLLSLLLRLSAASFPVGSVSSVLVERPACRACTAFEAVAAAAEVPPGVLLPAHLEMGQS